VLVNPRAGVTLVDADSFQVPGPAGVFRCRVGKAEYTPPELQDICLAGRDLGPEHDAFALGVLIFQLLMQGLHPFAGVCAEDGDTDPLPARIRAGWWPYAWKRTGPVRPAPHAPPWAVLPPAVQELLTCCFEDGHADPARRPSAAAWQQALEETEGQMAVCEANAQHHYPRGLDVCPWCALARDRGRDPFPSAEQIQALRATRLPNRTALHRAGLGLSQEMAAPAARPQLDPTDPLPPRPVEAASREHQRPEGERGRQAKAVSRERQRPEVGVPGSRAVWVAAGAIGAILGIVAVLWTYEPPPKPRSETPEAAVPHPPPVRPAVLAAEEAEQAWKQAFAECQEAQNAYQQVLREYEQSLKEFARNRTTREAVARNLERLRERAAVVGQRQRLLTLKTRLREEARQALLRDKS
jgi:hypothetical protein